MTEKGANMFFIKATTEGQSFLVSCHHFSVVLRVSTREDETPANENK